MNKLYDIPMSYTSVLGGLVVAPTFVAPILVKLQNVDSLPMLINLRHEFFLSHDFSWTLSQCRGLGIDESKFISYHAPLRCICILERENIVS